MNLKSLAVSGMLFFALAPAASFAQVSCTTTQCSGPASELLVSMFPREAGGVLINSATVVNAIGCTGSSGGNNILLDEAHGNYKETYALLLTASVAEKDIIMRIDDNNLAECTLKFARMIN